MPSGGGRPVDAPPLRAAALIEHGHKPLARRRTGHVEVREQQTGAGAARQAHNVGGRSVRVAQHVEGRLLPGDTIGRGRVADAVAIGGRVVGGRSQVPALVEAVGRVVEDAPGHDLAHFPRPVGAQHRLQGIAAELVDEARDADQGVDLLIVEKEVQVGIGEAWRRRHDTSSLPQTQTRGCCRRPGNNPSLWVLPIAKRVCEKGGHVGWSRRSIRWIMAR